MTGRRLFLPFILSFTFKLENAELELFYISYVENYFKLFSLVKQFNLV